MRRADGGGARGGLRRAGRRTDAVFDALGSVRHAAQDFAGCRGEKGEERALEMPQLGGLLPGLL